MARKRADLVPGAPDQITVRLPRARLRFDQFALTDIMTWLVMHQQRFARQASSLAEAATHGASCQAGADAATKAMLTVCDMLGRIGEAWSLRDWHDAQRIVFEVNPATTEAVTDTDAEAR